MLDEHHPTWANKGSNNVGSSKVGTLNPTLFDSLARALAAKRVRGRVSMIIDEINENGFRS